MSGVSAIPNLADPLPLLREQGVLTDLDIHFARLMGRLAGPVSPENGLAVKGRLELAAALASHATGQGDICVNLRQWTRRWHCLLYTSRCV